MSDVVVKPERPGGFLDYLPADYLAREKMLRTIESVFRSFGFDAIETPRIEFLKTLAGEQSDTGKNLFHIRSSNDDEPLAMPFDHTVPLARILAANPYDPKRKSGIRLPWRRMAVGPVFRADTPQSGRFRQFYQFDADIAGTASVLADAEIIALMHATMKAIGIERFDIRLNNRKILNGLAELATLTDRAEASSAEQAMQMMRILDKLDKIGRKGILAELSAVPQDDFDPAPQLSPSALSKIEAFLAISGANAERLATCEDLFGNIEIAREGIQELRLILDYMADLGVPDEHVVVDFSIARGLDYYTGPVMELVLREAPKFGAVFSGGRYNGLVSRFTGKELPATGASIGVDRLFAALDHIKALDRSSQTASEVMVLRISANRDREYLRLVTRLRNMGLNAELCLVEDTTFKSQFNFAISRGVKYVVICGDNEFSTDVVQVKNLQTRTQEEVALADLETYFDASK